MSALNALIAYKFIKLLVKKFTDWDAYKLGLIDENGDSLKKPKTREEKKAYGAFEKLVKNTKKIFLRTPLGAIKIGSLAVAVRMLKEEYGEETANAVVDEIVEHFDLELPLICESVESEVLEPNKYESDDGSVFVVKENLAPSEIFMNVPIYEVKDVISRETIFVTKDTVKPLIYK